jgi:hypothetical protein
VEVERIAVNPGLAPSPVVKVLTVIAPESDRRAAVRNPAMATDEKTLREPWICTEL